ncbi:MAG: hypothetical protein J6386_23305 [Candidatus Synoicihabitans palmerolidicus]|nr:hypothetical protein [Candidatus Synoicihabitans palmerolidicus]
MTTYNANATPPPLKPRRRGRWGHWILITMAALVVVAVVEAASMFRLGATARAVHAGIEVSSDLKADTEVQFTVGPRMIGLARLVTSFIDEVPTEAHYALSAVNSASVGVYKLRRGPTPEARVAILNRTSERMAEEGWSRMVAVMIFAPQNWLR